MHEDFKMQLSLSIFERACAHSIPILLQQIVRYAEMLTLHSKYCD